MSKKKILVIVGLVLLVAVIIGATIYSSQSKVTKVLVGQVTREDLVSTVSGTGQIKPKTYVNLGATSFGRITHLYVKEGDFVKKGQIVAEVEDQSPASQVAAQKETISTNQSTVLADMANEKTAEANVEEAKADLEQKAFDYQRYQSLYKEQLVSKADYDAKKSAYDVDVATLAQRQAAVAQAHAQTEAARRQVDQSIATLRGSQYSLDLTVSRAPFDALVTNVPVREGETVVVGIQNAEGSTLMTLADMSVITAEVKVDETDIVNVALGQSADVSVDALPGKIFKGHVTEVGDQALLRTTGIATSQSTTGTEEAKDFKVIVTLDDPSSELRPGLSATAKITTAHKPNVLTIPIQALTLHDPALDSKKSGAAVNISQPKTQPIQGVFTLQKIKGSLHAVFVPVQTGITGTTEIEVLGGLNEKQQIVIGPYKVLRTLKNNWPVKIDKTPQTITTDSGS